MSNISRNSLPQEFLDLTSDKMLIQPEPQYPYARMAMAAWAGAELKQAGITIGVDGPITDAGDGRSAPSHGAPVPALADMQLTLADVPAMSAIMVDTRLLGAGQEVVGHSVRFNRPLFTNSTYTEASRVIDSSATLQTTGQTIAAEQVNLTVKLVGGPYNNAASAIQPYSLFNFDAQRSVHSQAEFVGLNLARDRWRYLDTVFANYYTQGSVAVYPGDPQNAITTAANAFLAAGDRPMDVETVWRAEEQLESLSIPRFADGTYWLFLSPQQLRRLRSDPEFGKNAVFMPDMNVLKQSYVTSLGQVRVFVSATVPTTSVNSVTYYQGHMFGPGAVGYLPGWQCHTRSFNEDMAGLVPKVIWVAGEGHSVIDNRFIVNVLSD